MKSQLNEIQQLQKIAGILKENSFELNEAKLTDVIKSIDPLMTNMGYETEDSSFMGFPSLLCVKEFNDGSYLRVIIKASDEESSRSDEYEPPEFSTVDVIIEFFPVKMVKSFFGLRNTKQSGTPVDMLDGKEGINIDLGIGMFDIPVEESVNKVVSLVKKAEQKVMGMQQLKEDNEGASDEEIEKAIKSYTASDWKKSLWKSSAKKDFESMAKGGASDIKMKLYPKWTPEDFKAVLVSLEDKIK